MEKRTEDESDPIQLICEVNPSCYDLENRGISPSSATRNESTPKTPDPFSPQGVDKDILYVVEYLMDGVVRSLTRDLGRQGIREPDKAPKAAPPCGQAKKGRKRKFQMQTREDRKFLRLTNKQYISVKGTTVSPKQFLSDLVCKSSCQDKVSVEQRRQEYDGFWDLGSHEAKVLFVANRIQTCGVKRRRTSNAEKARSHMRSYFLSGVQVCKKCFAKTLCVSMDTVDAYFKKAQSDEIILDRRGGNGGWNRTEEAKIEIVKNHIRKFPPYQSNCTRGDASGRVLPSDVTVTLMYDLYKTEVENPVTLATYRNIFDTHFNPRRKALQNDCVPTGSSNPHKPES